MHRPVLVCLLLLFGFVARHSSAAEPVAIVGNDSQDGMVLLSELGCINCHATPEKPVTRRPAPLLGELGSRMQPEYLQAFLKEPHGTKPGTLMPDLLHGLPANDRAAKVEALAHFLMSLGESNKLLSGKTESAAADQGKLLYHTVGCVACHQPFEPAPKQKIDPAATVDPDEEAPKTPDRPAIPLPSLRTKTSSTALARFLYDPVALRPAGRMPGLGLDTKEANAIAAYLMSREVGPNETSADFAVDVEKAKEGRRLFTTIGCASCHSTATPSLPEKLDFALLQVKVEGYAPKENRSPPNEPPANAVDGKPNTKYLNFSGKNSGLKFTLPKAVSINAIAITSANDAENRDPASLLLEGSHDGKEFTRVASRDVPPFKDRFERQQLSLPPSETAYSIYRLTFPTLAGDSSDAMQIAEVEIFTVTPPSEALASQLKAKPLAELKPAAAESCLAERPAAGRPRFALSAAQRSAALEALKELQSNKPWTAERQVAHTMTALNCYACHARGEKGGADAAHNNYFTYAKLVELGDEGRLPPPIHEVGAKLTKDGFEDMLLRGFRYRTYMATRMPQFGKANIGHLPEAFAAADAGKIAAHAPAASKTKLISEGRKLAGKNTLACINCHAWAGSRIPGAEGLDLTLAPRRLKPEWFHAWLLDPQKIRPRTRMPTSWPDGKSNFPKILDGDTNQQIDALWAYISSGAKGGPPQGLSLAEDATLKPSDEPLVFRTFLDQVSAHAILVGHKEGTHAAFDANRVRLVLAWQGDFVSPRPTWEGRAGEYTKLPVKDPLLMPDGPPLAVLETSESPWPTDVPKKQGKIGSSRTPLGWQWKGYRYDKERRIVFMYRAGEVEVEETVTTEYRDAGGVLIRKLRLTSTAEPKGLQLLAGAGKKIEQKENKWLVDDRALMAVSGSPRLRVLDKRQELLLPIAFKAEGKEWVAEATVSYEW